MDFGGIWGWFLEGFLETFFNGFQYSFGSFGGGFLDDFCNIFLGVVFFRNVVDSYSFV